MKIFKLSVVGQHMQSIALFLTFVTLHSISYFFFHKKVGLLLGKKYIDILNISHNTFEMNEYIAQITRWSIHVSLKDM